MPDSRRLGVVLTVVLSMAVLALAGCTSSQSGQPSAAGTPSGAGGQVPTNNPSTVSLPPRPADLPLNSVDPCKLLTPAQQAQLGLNPAVRRNPDAQFHGPECFFQLANPGDVPAYFVNAVPSQGIQYWLNPDLTYNVRSASVAGFPAVDATGKEGNASGCTTVVSVANGQMLIVSLPFPPQGTTTAAACAGTEQVAAAAMTTLRTLK